MYHQRLPSIKNVLPEPPLVVYQCPPTLEIDLLGQQLRDPGKAIKILPCADNLAARLAPTLKLVAVFTAPPLEKCSGLKPLLTAEPLTWFIVLNVTSAKFS